MKQYQVYQTISIFVKAENEEKAIEKVKNEPSTYEGWTKWEVINADDNITVYVNDIPNDIIDFYPPIRRELK